MSGKLLQKLRQWRDNEAKRRGTDDYRVLQNRSLEEIAQKKPKNKDELLDIYGIAETKLDKYGDQILDIVAGDESEKQKESDLISVSTYLTEINDKLVDHGARVKGEVVEFDIRENYIFFTVSDADAKAAMQCFMWRREYDVSDVTLKEGLEIAVTGVPEVYKPSGRFTFRASTLELVGEGALKKAYEKLKAKLDEVGLFAEERKQDLPAFPQSLGLITSQESDAYHDFLANLGSFGFSVKFYPSQVQGAKAVNGLLEALDYFSSRPEKIDVLIITRGGGGNLEVLQAFNNETIIKKLADFDIPVVVGIGHEQDVPLASLVADRAVSTPTACAELLNKTWQTLTQRIQRLQGQLIRKQEQLLTHTNRRITKLASDVQSNLDAILTSFRNAIKKIVENIQTIGHQLKTDRQRLVRLSKDLFSSYDSDLNSVESRLESLADQLKRVDPQRRLKQGYSIIRGKGGVISSVSEAKKGDDIDVQISDGIINADVTNTQSQ